MWTRSRVSRLMALALLRPHSSLALEQLPLANPLRPRLSLAPAQLPVGLRAAPCRSSTASAAAADVGTGEDAGLAESVFATDKRPVILFDGVCIFCNRSVNFVLDFDPAGKFRFAPLQSRIGRSLLRRCGREPDDISSIVLVDESNFYLKSEAVLRIGQGLPVPFAPAAFAGMLVPELGRDYMYDQVAENRYNIFGKTDSCRVADDRFKGRYIPDPEE